MSYIQLDENNIGEFLVNAKCFNTDDKLEVLEISDGNINMVYRIVGEEKSLILKQAYPYVRVAGESWPLSLERAIHESDALSLQNKHAPGLVPEIIHRDDEMAVIVMEDLSYLEIMRKEMNAMKKFPEFPEHISTFLANQTFYTSDMYLSGEDKKNMVAQFINSDLCKITEDLIFTDPYCNAEKNIINPELKKYLETVFWEKENLRIEAAKLKYKFLTEAQSLLHGDLHTGSIFIDEKETKVFDTEFAFAGPSGFDIGLLTGNLLINYFSWNGRNVDLTAKIDYQTYILEMINELYGKFIEKFSCNWNNDIKDSSYMISGYKEYYMQNLFIDSIGFAAAAMIRRMHGFAHNIDVDMIDDLEKRRDVQIQVLEMGEKLMINRSKYNNIQEVTDFVSKS
ncbi:MAG TPA: S-methyl-5-thioribose kinase [Victivallales bacterium]|nr:S-methyl-5-thioribose kinase [Victivallales bacterium]